VTTYATLAELKASDEYQRAGIVERQRLQLLHFPEPWRTNTRSHLEEVAYNPEDIEAEGFRGS